jgi:acyl-coenzyme A synthetase/AMP-(fatty) acid ligase
MLQVKIGELLDFINSGISEEKKKLLGGIRIVDKIPRNPTGKIMRHLMKNGN